MTDTSKTPSKGAMRAVRIVVADDLWRPICPLREPTPQDIEALAQIIDRETKAGEMAELLRVALDCAKDQSLRPSPGWIAITERLLKELES